VIAIRRLLKVDLVLVRGEAIKLSAVETLSEVKDSVRRISPPGRGAQQVNRDQRREREQSD
jgi:hypothetical protein